MTKISFNATPLAVRGALKQARLIWQSRGVAPDVCDTGEQVLAEVFNNVVEHAQADRPGGQVLLETRCADGEIACVVRDDGAPMPGLQLPEGRLACHGGGLQDLPEGGFGWYMIRELTRNLTYDRDQGWNTLRFHVVPTDCDPTN